MKRPEKNKLTFAEILVAASTIGILTMLLISACSEDAEAQATPDMVAELDASVITWTADAEIYCVLDGEGFPVSGPATVILNNTSDDLLITGTLEDDSNNQYTLVANFKDVYEDSPDYYYGYRYAPDSVTTHSITLETLDGRTCGTAYAVSDGTNVLEWAPTAGIVAWVNVDGIAVDLIIRNMSKVAINRDPFDSFIAQTEYDNLFNYTVTKMGDADAWKGEALRQKEQAAIWKAEALRQKDQAAIWKAEAQR